MRAQEAVRKAKGQGENPGSKSVTDEDLPSHAELARSNSTPERAKPGWALLVYVLATISQSIFSIPLLVLVAAGFGISVTELFSDESSSLDIPIAANMMVYAGTVMVGLAVVLIYLKLVQKNFTSLKLKTPSLASMLSVFPAFILYFAVSALVFWALKKILPLELLEQDQVTGFEDPSGSLDMVFAFIALVVIAPISEELLYRGFLLSNFKDRISKPVAVVGLIVTTLFVVGQLTSNSLSELDPSSGSSLLIPIPIFLALAFLLAPQHLLDRAPRVVRYSIAALVVSAFFGVAHGQLNVAVDTFILSIFMVVLTIKSGSIYPAIFLHALKNGMAFYFLFINPDFIDTL